MTSKTPLQTTSRPQTELLLSGNSIYLDTGQEKGTVLYYGASWEVRVLHASGKRDTGKWTLLDDGSYCIDWVEGPKCSCSRIHWYAGTIQIFNLAGEPRGRVVKIVPGLVHELM